MVVSVPAVKASPYNIQYLSFQGGGGKGIAYLGALNWLEMYPDNASTKTPSPLPLYNGQQAGNRIVGVTGASAGAITALFVALGYYSDDIQSKLTSLDLVDPPEPGLCRSVPPDVISPPDDSNGSGLISDYYSAVAALLQSNQIQQYLEPMLSKLTNDNVNNTTYKILSNLNYLYCLAMDGGMLSGAKLLAFLQQAITDSPLLHGMTKSGPLGFPTFDGTSMTFGDFWRFNQRTVMLAICATNLTTGRPMVFSHYTTPNFPVADAVAISASFPFLFKSVWVSSQQSLGSAARKSDYVGWYADGGLTNNVPIHVFDNVSNNGQIIADPTGPVSGPMSNSFTPGLNPGVLGLRLAAGDAPVTSSGQPPPDPQTTQSVITVSGAVLGAMQFGANDGQLRDPFERNQTVIIQTDGLNLTDFSPPQQAINTAKKNGYNAMAAYYSMPGQ